MRNGNDKLIIETADHIAGGLIRGKCNGEIDRRRTEDEAARERKERIGRT